MPVLFSTYGKIYQSHRAKARQHFCRYSMSEMVERVARVLFSLMYEGSDPDDIVPLAPIEVGEELRTGPAWRWLEPLALAAINAMREPTEKIIEAVSVYLPRVQPEDRYAVVTDILGAAIDAALNTANPENLE